MFIHLSSLKHSIAAHLLRSIFGWYLALAAAVTTLQLSMEYIHVSDGIVDDVKSLSTTFASGISDALWNYDVQMLQAIVDGLHQNPAVTSVQVTDERGAVVASVGTESPTGGGNNLFAMDYLQRIPLMRGDRKIGVLDVRSSRTVAFRRVAYGFFFILINSFINTAGLGVIVIICCNRLLVAPLGRLKQQVEHVDFDILEKIDIAANPACDFELYAFEFAFNRMLEKLSGARRDLIAMNTHLDALVQERTAELRQMALMDALTNLPNRRSFVEFFGHAVARAARTGQEGALFYLDLDGFKLVNDRQGHEAGDRLLVSVASQLSQTLRETDFVARLGGDEFVVISEGDTEGGADEVAKCIRRAVHEGRRGISDQVTASIGISFFNGNQRDIDIILQEADKAMYQAKKLGKDRAVYFEKEEKPL